MLMRGSAYGLIGIVSAIVLIALIYGYGAAPQISPSSSSKQQPSGSTSPETITANNPAPSSLKTFASYNSLNDFVANSSGNGQSYPFATPVPNVVPVPVPTTAPSAAATTGGQGTSSTSSFGTTNYSPTNIQVAGVDEADNVKTDGQYLYVLSNNAVYILNAGSSDPKDASVITKIPSSNTYVSGIYLSQDGSKLAVLGNQYTPYSPVSKNSSLIEPPFYSPSTTFVNVYDVTDKANPVLVRNFTMSGNYFDSRMVGDYVYDIVTENVYVNNGSANLPVVFVPAGVYNVDARAIYYIGAPANYYSYTTVVGVNIMDDSKSPSSMTVMMGGSSEMYVSQSNIYLTSTTWSGMYSEYNEYTDIYRVSIDQGALTLQAKGSVTGSPINQYAMDEFNGDFRIATNTYFLDNATTSDGAVFQVTRQANSIYVLDANLNVVGKLLGFKMDESLTAVRFLGDVAYVVTAKQTDPFFVIDMSDPTAPKVAGQLQLPGYSSFLYPIDANHVIGVGMLNETVKLSLFDATNVSAPVEIARYLVNASYSYSTASYDPHAFLYDAQNQMLVIPIQINNNIQIVEPMLPSTTSGSQPATGTPNYWQGVYIFKVDFTSGITLVGNVTQLDSNALANGTSYWMNYNYDITRSLYIGNTLYTISTGKVQLNSLSTFEILATVELS